MKSEYERIRGLRDEIAQVLAHALELADETDAEAARVQQAHNGEMRAAQQVHEQEVHSLEAALASRDVLGQAKGIIMVTMHCTADEAFALIVKQSQAENRKAVDIATEIAQRVARRATS